MIIVDFIFYFPVLLQGKDKFLRLTKWRGERKGATDIDERSLIQKTLIGDRQAFQPLVEAYSRLIYTSVIKIVRDPEVAEDIAQEVFLQAYRSLDSFRMESAFSTWLTRIAVNKSLDHCRKQKSVPIIQELNDCIPAGGEDPQTQILKQEEVWQLREQVQNLPAIYRRVILDHYFNELSYREIAQRDEVSVKTVESRIYRAKALLRNSGMGGAEGEKLSAT